MKEGAVTAQKLYLLETLDRGQIYCNKFLYLPLQTFVADGIFYIDIIYKKNGSLLSSSSPDPQIFPRGKISNFDVRDHKISSALPASYDDKGKGLNIANHT